MKGALDIFLFEIIPFIITEKYNKIGGSCLTTAYKM